MTLWNDLSTCLIGDEFLCTIQLMIHKKIADNVASA